MRDGTMTARLTYKVAAASRVCLAWLPMVHGNDAPAGPRRTADELEPLVEANGNRNGMCRPAFRAMHERWASLLSL
jgi:hypothetical protein